MKKLLLALPFLFAGGLIAQTIVSTTPENKKVILEEFTGINCVFCPDGHAIAQAFQNANQGEVFIINIHVGGFATPGAGQPDFRTPFGTAIANQSGLVGYPAGTINRTFFPGLAQNGANGTAMSRGNWANAGNQTLAQSSYLNMGVEAEIDAVTRELTVHVEAFYTGNSPVSTNKLNVALLQNNTLGPQTGGNMGDNYVHQHRLVHLVTGQWGEDITTTSTGSFVDRTYTYTIPADYNGVEAKIQDMEIVVFMSETTQRIVSGNGALPTFTNLPANDAGVQSNFEFEEQCGIDFAPTVRIQNTGGNDLTSLNINYSINGGATETFNWTGNLATFESEDVVLDPIPYTIQATNTVNISIPSDGNNANNTATNTFGQLTDVNTNYLDIRILTDNNGDEITWSIVNLDGDVVASGGPYPDNANISEEFSIPDAGCHKFILNDAGGDGDYYIRLRDSNNDIIYFINSEFGGTIERNFNADGVLNTNDFTQNQVALFPNPANNQITITNAENAQVAIFDVLGKNVLSQNITNTNQIVDVSTLQTGTYFVKINNDNFSTVKKLVINK